MGTTERDAAAPVNQDESVDARRADALRQIAARGRTVSFLPLVAYLERFFADAPRVGSDGPASNEVIRFRHNPALTFSAGDVANVRVTETAADPTDFTSRGRTIVELVTTFLGLTGSATPLPYYLAEEVAQEDPDRPRKRDFLDLFHHRLVSLLYRAVRRYDLTADASRDGSDIWSRRVLALAAVDTVQADTAPAASLARLLRLSSLLATRARTARTLEVALEDALSDEPGIGRVALEQFVGAWVPLDDENLTRLGRVNSRLGKDAVVGRRVFDRSGAFRISLGPASYGAYRRLLPTGDLMGRIDETVRLFTREALDYSVRVTLAPEAVPRLTLSSQRRHGLGRDTWLGRTEISRTHVDLRPAS